MVIKNLLDLVCTALPKGVERSDLELSGKLEWWQQRPHMACAYALRKCPKLSWSIYLNSYPDVKNAGYDPVWHFLTHGIFEGRKLYYNTSWDYNTNVYSHLHLPSVTVIIPNYNNAIFLDKCISSVRGQTLKEIEIIIIDDNSCDNSGEVISAHCKADSRLKVITLLKNSSQHMCRKAGVRLARGEAVMFLDSDDFFMPDACKVAYEALCEGNDIVCFDAKCVYPARLDQTISAKMEAYLNRGSQGVYLGKEIVLAAYAQGEISDILTNKIYRASLCKHAFNEMEDGYFPRGQDIYETLVLLSKAQRLAHIQKQLWCYRVANGVSTPDSSARTLKLFLTTGDLARPVRGYLRRHGLNECEPLIIPIFLNKSVEAWLHYAPPRMSREFFYTLSSQYGIIELLGYLAERHSQEWEKIAERISQCQLLAGPERIRSVGIIYEWLGNGGAENVIKMLCEMLLANGFDVVVFLEKAHGNEIELNPAIKVVYTGDGRKNKDDLINHLKILYKSLLQHPVDILMHHAIWSQMPMWDMIIAKYMRIPVIAVKHSAFYRPLFFTRYAGAMREHLKIIACADKIICLSIYDELFYRLMNLDATYIHNPVPNPSVASAIPDMQNIIVFGRLAEPIKQTKECLLIAHEVSKTVPNIKITFIGSFVSDEKREEFYACVRDLGLWENVEVTGWIRDTEPLIDRASILLSASYSEAFPLAIAEAQAHGVPCVIYDLPIMLARDNESIIRVPQGNIKSAAAAILALLKDEDRCRKLRQTAVDNAMRFSAVSYFAKTLELLQTWHLKSDITNYSRQDYETVMRSLAFYSAGPLPWERTQ